jgi:alkylhydroperoxidase family enzyme
MDTNAVGSSAAGASEAEIAAVERWRESDEFEPAERAALALAEAATATPAEVSDEVFAEARRHFSEQQLVELAATVALENYRARLNRVFAVESQGFFQRRARRPGAATVADQIPTSDI